MKYRITTRRWGSHDVTADSKREAVARLCVRLCLTEQQCAACNTWAVSEKENKQ